LHLPQPKKWRRRIWLAGVQLNYHSTAAGVGVLRREAAGARSGS
jgi:hypothetical protein